MILYVQCHHQHLAGRVGPGTEVADGRLLDRHWLEQEFAICF